MPEHVEYLGVTPGWLRYRLPHQLVRQGRRPVCIGQKQKWFLLRLRGAEELIRFDCSPRPEFDGWRWVDYWLPIDEVVSFKRSVYHRALDALAPLLGHAPREKSKDEAPDSRP
jgi:putative (di)nucleoside polyphosphate hydrolase